MSKTRAKSKRLADVVQVAERFHRSVHLRQDWDSEYALEGYLVTPTVKRLTREILAELGDERGTRAWSLTGPYGTGKSAFALFLAEVLCKGVPSGGGAVELREQLRAESGFDYPGYVPVLVVADRGPLPNRIAETIGERFGSLDSKLARRARKLAKTEVIHGEQLADLVEAAALAAEAEARGGLLLIVDEFGKFLEFAAERPEERDLLFLQTLAESAARCAVPVLFMTILHTGFVDYLDQRDEVHRREWRKVQGRFRDVAFQLPAEQMLALVGQAIKVRLPKNLRERWRALTECVVADQDLQAVAERIPVQTIVPQCLPLHPLVALLLWPVFRGKLAQNERSLFAFLTSPEPHGFKDFLHHSALCDDSELYSVARLYDYVRESLALGAFRGDHGRRWAQIDRALGRIDPESSGLEVDLVKSIGLISTYGSPIGLEATEGVLRMAVGHGAGSFDAALQSLQQQSIVVFRRHRNAFALWEGSDVDLDGEFERARRKVGGGSLAARLQRAVDLRPVVARAHYIRSGTLRYFDVAIVDGEQRAIEGATDTRSARTERGDGSILFVLGEQASFEDLVSSAADVLGPLTLLAVPDKRLRIGEALLDLEAWTWVAKNVPALQGDEVARQEVKARISHARDEVERKAGPLLGLSGHRFRPELSTWYHDGEKRRIQSGRQFQRWLSDLCDAVFDEAPELHNELLNRQSLSSASTAARRNLIEAMLQAPDQDRLGIEGTPAEASMYESMLADGDFHQRCKEGGWQFTVPAKKWRPVWDYLADVFERSTAHRKGVAEVFDALGRPPFGVRSGPVPVLFVAFMLVHRHEFALYEDGVFVPEVTIEVIERLLSRPETFEVQTHTLSKVEREVLATLAKKAPTLVANGPDQDSLLSVVKGLVKQAAQTNSFTRKTRQLEPEEALAVRDVLLAARSPKDLLFDELPTSLGLEIDSKDQVVEFADRLRDCLLAIHRAYPALLDRIEQAIRSAFDLPDGPAVAAVAGLKRRAKPLVDYALEGDLQVFVREAARLDNQRDWREVLGRVGQGGMPPKAWSDIDEARFKIRLKRIAFAFERLEELVLEDQGRDDRAGPVFRIGVLDGAFDERRAVVSVDSGIADVVTEAEGRVREVLENLPGLNGNGRRVRLAALARVATSMMDGETPNDAGDS